MKDYKVEIMITNGEEDLFESFYIEAESFDEAVKQLENDLDIYFSR